VFSIGNPLGGEGAEEDLLSQNGIRKETPAGIRIAQLHHIVTTYAGAGEDAAQSREILADAGISVEDDANLTPVVGHAGGYGSALGHPPAYHTDVLNQLQEAVGDLMPGSDQYREAVKSALLDLKNQLFDPTNPLTMLLTTSPSMRC
jgi:hypothetical protein